MTVQLRELNWFPDLSLFKVVGNPRGTITKFFKSWLAKYLIYGEFLYQV